MECMGVMSQHGKSHSAGQLLLQGTARCTSHQGHQTKICLSFTISIFVCVCVRERERERKRERGHREYRLQILLSRTQGVWMRFRPFPPNAWNSKDKTIMLRITCKAEPMHTDSFLPKFKIKGPQNLAVLP
ncbi:hypothetical protein PDJAM_G00005630, partial [Pangasius djambal]|nr:hypothetical protein [Pangasius djambal]